MRPRNDAPGAMLAAGLLLAGTLLMMGGAARAQGPGDGPPPPPPGGGFGGPPPFPGRPGGPGMRRMTAATVPVEALAAGLSLSDEQKTKIADIQATFRQDARAQMPPPPGDAPGGGPPDPAAMKARFTAMQGLETKASQQIEATLTADQKKVLPDLLKSLRVLGAAGIPPRVYADLKLTADQRAKLAAAAPAEPTFAAGQRPDPQKMRAARQKARAAVTALLTTDQQKTVEAFRRDHPGPGRRPGGPGGFGGPDGGAPPPPPGGPDDAPPPPPADNAT
jgi:hypothetical protein